MLIGAGLELSSIIFAYIVLKIFINFDINFTNEYMTSFLELFSLNTLGDYVKFFSILLILIYIIKFLYFIYLYYKQTYFIYYIKSKISVELFEIYLSKNIEFLLKKNSAELIRNIKDEVNMFSLGVIQSLLHCITEIVIVSFIIIFLLYTSFKLTVSAVLFFSIIFIIYYFFVKNIFLNLGYERQKITLQNLKDLMQPLRGFKDVKIFQKENHFTQIYNKSSYKLAGIATKSQTLNMIPRLCFEFFLVSSVIIYILYLDDSKSTYKNSLESLGLFAIASFRLLPSISRIFISLQQFRYNKSAVKVVLQELEEKNKDIKKNNINNLREIQFNNEIKIQNLNYEYQKRNFKLNNINLIIRKNEFVAVIGESGSGKSTLLDLISGLSKPSSGKILIDNFDIDENVKSWQNKIGYISQNTFLLDDSIKNNIIFGSKTYDQNKIMQLISNFKLTSLIENSQEGLETNIGEGGSKLSGGQKQRLALARCFYSNSQIIILDEATSALDIETENEILTNLKEQQKDKTIIIVSHREYIKKFCDKTYQISNGNLKIVK